MASIDRYEPRLRVKASGMGGSGYVIPTRLTEDGKMVRCAGVTTVLGAIDKPGITQWAVNQTAAYAVHNVDALLDRTEEVGMRYLQWYWRRMKPADFDDPEIDILNAHSGVLNDLAELGSITHDWVSDFVTDQFDPIELTRDEQAQMVSAFLDWWDEHDVEVILTERTVVGDGYAGTLDHMWIVDGIKYLVDLKGLPLDTPIPTPTGWSTMGDLQVGDSVFGSDGKVAPVTAKSEVHHNPCYKITFDTGEEVIADKDHRWAVTTGVSKNPKDVVMTTEDMAQRIETRGSRQKDIRIMNPKPLDLPSADLPIDPYVLGVWLGDGTATKNEITINKTTKVGIIQELESRGWVVDTIKYPSDKDNDSLRIHLGDYGAFSSEGVTRKSSMFKGLLRDLGVLGNKHIPAQYLRASYDQRLDLLRGLMDTDGTINIARNNEVSLTTTDESMTKQIAELVATFGWKPYVSSNPVSWTHKGVKKWTTAWKLSFRPTGDNPFLVRAKDIPTTTLSKYRIVRSVESVDTVPTQCIEVGSPDHTYLFGKNMIVTHNTSRKVRDEHLAQLGALGAAESMMTEVDADDPGGVEYDSKQWGKTYWKEEPIPAFTNYGILHLRPAEDGKPPRCEFEVIPNEVVDSAYELFRGALAVRRAQVGLKMTKKSIGFKLD